MPRWLLNIKLRWLQIQRDDASRSLQLLDAERPLVQARLCALEDECNSVANELYPLHTFNPDLEKK